MRRRHRETGGGEVAMMAVITKAMGAFLVLMIMLLPYYTGDTQSQQTVDDTGHRIDEAKAGLEDAVDRLKKGRLTDAEIDEVLKRLQRAHDELTEAQSLIAQLRIKVDQAASQINRLEQQNAALQAQVAALQNQAAQLQAEIEKLKQEIARLRAVDTEALQARIRELEAEIARLRIEVAKIVPLQNQNAAQVIEIEKLKNENEVLRVLSAFPDIFLLSKCDLPITGADLAENPINFKGFKTVDQLIPTLMPWRDYSPNPNFTKRIEGDAHNSTMTHVSLSFEEGQEYQYDFFVRIWLSGQGAAGASDRFYANIEKDSAKDADGSVMSTANHPSCQVNIFIKWRGDVTFVKSFTLGPVEPVVHAGRVVFLKNGKIQLPPEDRPVILQTLTAEICNRYGPFCALAKQHALLRTRNRNPWDVQGLDAALSGSTPQPSMPGPPKPRPQPRL